MAIGASSDWRVGRSSIQVASFHSYLSTSQMRLSVEGRISAKKP